MAGDFGRPLHFLPEKRHRMCGIIGYVGNRNPQEVLLSGLRKLEYRGYDSAGIAWRENGTIHRVRSVGNLDALDAALAGYPAEQPDGSPKAGIGHTRWATHGGVTELNAHPHEDVRGGVRIVLNGIIENYLELRWRLQVDGVHCSSETDAEVVAQLIALYYDGHLSDAVRLTLGDLKGHYAFVAMHENEPETLVGVRKECPLILGLGKDENFIGSSTAAFRSYTKKVGLLGDDEIVVMRPGKVKVLSNGFTRQPTCKTLDSGDEVAEKNGYETFMLKEIHEQPSAVTDTLVHYRTALGTHSAATIDRFAASAQRIVIIGCGKLPRRTGRWHGHGALGSCAG